MIQGEQDPFLKFQSWITPSIFDIKPPDLDQIAYFDGTFLVELKKEIAFLTGFEPLTFHFDQFLISKFDTMGPRSGVRNLSKTQILDYSSNKMFHHKDTFSSKGTMV